MSSQSFFFRAVDRVISPRLKMSVVAGVVAIGLIVLQTGFGQSLLKTTGVSRPTSSFLALSFPNAQTLPTSTPTSGRFQIRFALSNVGLTSRSFAWQVSEPSAKAQLRLATGRTLVRAGRTDLVARNVRVHCSSQRIQLIVSVKRSSARIMLWLACPRRR